MAFVDGVGSHCLSLFQVIHEFALGAPVEQFPGYVVEVVLFLQTVCGHGGVCWLVTIKGSPVITEARRESSFSLSNIVSFAISTFQPVHTRLSLEGDFVFK